MNVAASDLIIACSEVPSMLLLDNNNTISVAREVKRISLLTRRLVPFVKKKRKRFGEPSERMSSEKEGSSESN